MLPFFFVADIIAVGCGGGKYSCMRVCVHVRETLNIGGEKMLTNLDTKGHYPKVKGKKRKLAELLCNPDSNLTVTQMCEEIGVSRQTFYNWQRDSDFMGYVEFLIESFTDSELANAWKALVKKANSGNVEALKLFFEMKGKYKQTVNLNQGVVFITGEDKLEN